jgi:hypothetical protein
MTRLLQFAAVIVVLVVGFRWLRGATQSDEEQITAVVERMVDGIDEGNPSRALSGFDRDRYVDASGLGYEDLRSALLYLFLQQRRDLDATLDPVDGLVITVEGEAAPPRAVVEFHCRIDEIQPNGARTLYWDLRGTGELEEVDGDWRFVRSRDVDHASRPRF